MSCLFLQASAYANADPEGQTGLPVEVEASDDSGPVILMFPLLTKGGPSGRIVERAQSELETLVQRISGARVIARPALRTWIKEKPRKALYRCGMNLECLAALGAKAGADEVLISRATGNRRRVQITLLVINVETAKVARGTSLVLVSPAAVRPAIEKEITKIFGEGATLQPRRTGPAEEASAPLASTEGEAEAAQASDAASEEVAATRPAEEEDADGDLGPRSAALALAMDPTPFDDATILAPAGRGSTSLLFYGGIGLAGLGAGALGIAGYFGRQSGATRGEIERDGSITQRQALDMGEEANRLGRRANLFLLIGGGLLLTGSALLGVDWFSVEPAPALEATP